MFAFKFCLYITLIKPCRDIRPMRLYFMPFAVVSIIFNTFNAINSLNSIIFRTFAVLNKKRYEKIQSKGSFANARARRVVQGKDKGRPPTVQAPHQARHGDGERKGKRGTEPIFAKQHLASGRVEIATHCPCRAKWTNR